MVSISFLLLCLLLCAKRDVCRVRWLEVFRTFPVFSLAVEMTIEFSFFIWKLKVHCGNKNSRVSIFDRLEA
jgi:hypothetical protein